MPSSSVETLGTHGLTQEPTDEDDPRAGAPHGGGDPHWSDPPSLRQADPQATRERLAHLTRTLEDVVIPRLVRAHRPAPLLAPSADWRPAPESLEAFVIKLICDDDSGLSIGLEHLRREGVKVESIYLHLLAPAARRLGQLWDEDHCDFSTVSIGILRLQRLMRSLSPGFGAEVVHAPHARRVLFAHHPQERHLFGLSMVAEFFRRDGWDVVPDGDEAQPSAAHRVAREWVDLAGFTLGSSAHETWLREAIAAVREASRNLNIVVMVGGPPFQHDPGLVQRVGADAMAADAQQAPVLAERLIAGRHVVR